MTWLDFRDQRSKVKVTAGLSLWWRSHPRRRWGVEVHLLVYMSYDIFISGCFFIAQHVVVYLYQVDTFQCDFSNDDCYLNRLGTHRFIQPVTLVK